MERSTLNIGKYCFPVHRTDHYSDTDKLHSVVITLRLKDQAVLCPEVEVENRTLSRNTGSETKSPTNTNSACKLTNRHREVELLSTSSACHHPQPENIPFPSGQPRGKEAGNVAGFGDPLDVYVSICLLVTNGGSSSICSFACWHMTRSQPVFFGSDTPQILAGKFSGSGLNVVTQWLPSFQHEQKQIIVFISSFHGDAPTQADSRD